MCKKKITRNCEIARVSLRNFENFLELWKLVERKELWINYLVLLSSLLFVWSTWIFLWVNAICLSRNLSKADFDILFFFIIYKRKHRYIFVKRSVWNGKNFKNGNFFPRRYHSILIYAYIIGYNIMHRLTLTFRISPNRWTSCACFIKYETSVSTHGDAYTPLFKILLKFLRKNLLKLRNHWKKNCGSYLNYNTLKKLFKGRIFFYLFKPLFSAD